MHVEAVEQIAEELEIPKQDCQHKVSAGGEEMVMGGLQGGSCTVSGCKAWQSLRRPSLMWGSNSIPSQVHGLSIRRLFLRDALQHPEVQTDVPGPSWRDCALPRLELTVSPEQPVSWTLSGRAFDSAVVQLRRIKLFYDCHKLSTDPNNTELDT